MRDVTAVSPIRTVVRLGDLDDARLAPDLAASFVLTSDAAHVLSTVLGDVRSGRGRGYFLEGPFGSGKSHLMAVLAGLLRGSMPAEALGAGLQPGVWRRSGGISRSDLPARPLLAVPVSLVAHSAREALEQAVLHGAVSALGGGAAAPGDSRQDVFGALAGRIRDGGFAGMVICLDELSEFLRSKADGRAFAEDVRFLQFLGEWAEAAPAWIVCGVQEAVEQTGGLPAPAFGKIRDRYPVRFRLAGGHIRDLIEQRLIQRPPGAQAAVRALHARLGTIFGGLPFTEEEFVALYPVHPATVEFLEELRPLFSQQRGVVDFIVSRLAGDPARRIPPLLEQPADRLLGPDAVVEHFRDRIRERPETAPLVTVALAFFERELPRLFADEESARVALALGRILIAGALFPTPRAFSARELADALLHRLTDLEPRLNLAFVTDILERMVVGGAYVARTKGRAPATPPATHGVPSAGFADTRYCCDIQADIALVVRRRLEYLRSGLLPDDARVWNALVPWCEDARVPLARLAGQPRSAWDITWRRTPRRVLVWLTRVSALSASEAREAARVLETSETDVVLFMAPGYADEADAALRRWGQELAPALVGLHPALPALVWVPRAPSGEESERLRDLVSHALLEAEAAGDRSATGERIRGHLAEHAAERRRQAADLFSTLYLEGALWDAAGNEADPGGPGVQPFAAWLEAVCERPLRNRFPLHPHLPARPELLGAAAVERAVGELVRAGDAGAVAPDAAAAAVLDQFLLPLGLCRRGARGYRLMVDAGASLAVRGLLSRLEGASAGSPVRVDELYGRLRKGEAGMHRRIFELVCYTLVRCGAAGAVRGGRRVSPHQIRLAALWDLDGLVPGTLVDGALQTRMEALSFLPARLRTPPLTHTTQREAWDAVVEWRQKWCAALPAVRQELASVRDLPSLRPLLTPEWCAELDGLEVLLAAVAPTMAPHEGLQRLLEAVSALPAAAETVERSARLRTFLERRIPSHLHMVGYVGGGDFAPPPDQRAAAAELVRLLRDPTATLGDGFAAAEALFGSVRHAHAQAYAAAHRAAVGSAAFAGYEEVCRGPAYRLATLLGDLPGLQVEPDAARLQGEMRTALAMRCDVDPAALEDRLRRLPLCACGFRLDRPLGRPSVEGIESLARASATAHLGALRIPELAERVRAYAAGLEAVGRRDGAQAMHALLLLPEDDPRAPERALEFIRRADPDELRAALGGRAPVVERDGADLLARLAGRAHGPEQLLEAVRTWMGPVDSGVFVRVVWAGRPEAAVVPPNAADLPLVPAAGAEHWRRLARRLASGSAAAAECEELDARAPTGDARADDAAQAAASVRAALGALAALRSAASRPPRSVEQWAALWLGPAGQSARALAEVHDACALAGCAGDLPLARWRADAGDALERLRPAFAAALEGAAADQRGGLSPAVLRARALAAAGGATGVFLWCVDGMRCDLLPLVLDVLRGGGIGLRVAERGTGWAVSPTTTASQFEALRAVGYRGELLRWDDGTASALASDPAALLAELDWSRADGDGCIVKWGFVDAKVHSVAEDFGSFCAEVRAQAGRRLCPPFAALPTGALVVLCADHGFRQADPRAHPARTPDGPRYIHGGDSPDEVLAPWCVLEIG